MYLISGMESGVRDSTVQNSTEQYSTVSGMEAESETAGAEFSVSKAKLFPTQTNTTDYKLRLPPTPAQHFTIQHIIDSRNISKK